MNNFEVIDTMDIAIVVDAISSIAKQPYATEKNVWAVGGAYTVGYWHKDWQFGDDGKAYFPIR